MERNDANQVQDEEQEKNQGETVQKRKTFFQKNKEKLENRRNRLKEKIEHLEGENLSKVEKYIEKLEKNRLKTDIDTRTADYPYNCFFKTEARYYA